MDESDAVIKERPQYVTLTRVSQKKDSDREDETEIEGDKPSVVESGLDDTESDSRSPTTQSPQYVVIRRNRPSTTESPVQNVEEGQGETDTGSVNRPNQYISINRGRPTKQDDVEVETASQPETKYAQNSNQFFCAI